MVLTFLDVTGRYFIRPVTGTFELSELALAMIVFLSLGYTQINKGHISVSFLVEKLPERGQLLVNMIGYLLCLAIIIITGWQMWENAVMSSSRVTGQLNLPISVFMFVAAIGLLLFALSFLLDFLKSFQKAVLNKNES